VHHKDRRDSEDIGPEGNAPCRPSRSITYALTVNSCTSCRRLV